MQYWYIGKNENILSDSLVDYNNFRIHNIYCSEHKYNIMQYMHRFSCVF